MGDSRGWSQPSEPYLLHGIFPFFHLTENCCHGSLGRRRSPPPQLVSLGATSCTTRWFPTTSSSSSYPPTSAPIIYSPERASPWPGVVDGVGSVRPSPAMAVWPSTDSAHARNPEPPRASPSPRVPLPGHGTASPLFTISDLRIIASVWSTLIRRKMPRWSEDLPWFFARGRATTTCRSVVFPRARMRSSIIDRRPSLRLAPD
nr:uncharacterized protein LOC127317196 isoform X2 [Lolium perenne]